MAGEETVESMDGVLSADAGGNTALVEPGPGAAGTAVLVEEVAEPGESATPEAEPDDIRVVTYPVAPGYRVNVRKGPSTTSQVVKVLAYDVRVPIYCQCPGETVSGPYGTTKVWDNIGPGQFVSDAYVHTGSDGYVAPRCA